MIVQMKSEEMKDLLQSEEVFALIDVREKNEYESGQIFGATQVARSSLEFRMPVLVQMKNTKIILYSNYHERSLLAAKILERYGYSNVFYLEGGLNSWKIEEYPVVEGTHVVGKVFGEIVGDVRKTMTKISPKELRSWMQQNDNYIVLEVRPSEAVSITGSIPGAINIPGVELAIKITDYIEDGRKIVTTCAGHTRGYISSATLNLMGIEQVYDLECGTLGWQLAGFDLEKGTPQGPQPSMSSKKASDAFAERLVKKHNISLIDVKGLQDLLNNDGDRPTYLLDVRTVEEYEVIGHIPNSTTIPGGQAIQNSDDFVAVHGANIVFICDNGTRSTITAYWYKETGYPNVYVLEGGLNAWTRQGNKLDRGRSKVSPLGFQEAINVVEQNDPLTLKTMLDNHSELLLIDVGSSRSFKSGHISGAHWVPRGRLEKRISQYAPNKESFLVITCPDGINSILAAATLKELGYKRVSALNGGKNACRNIGIPMVAGLEGIDPDDWFVFLSEYNLEEAKKYFAWEDSLIHLPEYTNYFKTKGIL